MNILNALVNKHDLDQLQAQELAEAIVTDKYSPTQIAAILTALRAKGETATEVTGFIKTLQNHMTVIKAPKGAIDTCGTGGDGAGSFNISTAVSFVVAAAGVPVAKHGNRAASSKCGSADVLEALGATIAYSPSQAETILKKAGIVFLFAQLYHHALKPLAPIRKELGIRTIFNFLGPFLNPARVKKQIIGVPTVQAALLLQHVIPHLDYDHVYLLSGHDGMDEISISSPTHIVEFTEQKIREFTVHPETYGFSPVSKTALAGGTAEDNAHSIKTMFAGERGPRRDIVILNSAYALMVAGAVKNVQEGIELANHCIDSGKAAEKLNTFIRLSKTDEKHS